MALMYTVLFFTAVVYLTQGIPLDNINEATGNEKPHMKILDTQSGGPSGASAPHNIRPRSVPGAAAFAGGFFDNANQGFGNINADFQNSPKDNEGIIPGVGRSETGAGADNGYGAENGREYPKYQGPEHPAMYKKTKDPRRFVVNQNRDAAAHIRMHAYAQQQGNGYRKEDDSVNQFGQGAHYPGYGFNVGM